MFSTLQSFSLVRTSLVIAVACLQASWFSLNTVRAGEPAVSVQVDLDAFAKSKLGGLLIKAGTQLAASEMDKDPGEAMDAVIETLGFDPLKQRARLAIDVMDLEDPLAGMRAVLSMKDSTGNLEGLLLAAPGYQSIEQGDRVIHSVSPDGQPVFIAFDTASSGAKRIVAAASLETVNETLQSSAGPLSQFPEGQFVNVQLMSLPKEVMEGTPATALIELLKETSLSVGEDGSNLSIRISLTANDSEKAAQIQQLAQGIIAMVGLFKEEIGRELDDEETAKQMLSVINQIIVARDGSNVTVKTSIPEETVITFLREEADLPL